MSFSKFGGILFSLGESPLHYLDLLAISRSGFVMSASFTMFTFPPPGRGFSTTWSWLLHHMWKSHHQVMESAHSI